MVKAVGPSQQILRKNLQLRNGSQKVVELVKENNRLTNATISQIGKDGKEYKEKNYRIGNNEFITNQYEDILKKIKELCDKAKDGVELFKDIMGWVK